MNSSFYTEISPTIKVGADFATAIDVFSSKSFYIPESLRPRLAQLSLGRSFIAASDVELMQLGVVQLSHQATTHRDTVRSEIEAYFSSSGALAVMPTEKCNLRCRYCYETFEKGKMSEGTIAGVELYLSKAVAQFQYYSLAWFGGEPLMHPEIIERISSSFRSSIAHTNTSGNIAITTNGYFLGAKVRRILNNIAVDLLQISLDGPRDTHNMQRPIKGSGNNTYDVILENTLAALEETDASLILRVNIDAANNQASNAVTQWLVEEIFPKIRHFGTRVSIHVVPIWSASTRDVEGICLNELARAQSLIHIKRNIAKLTGLMPHEAFVKDVGGLGTLACYAGKPNHFVVGADGAVYKCTVAFDMEENQVGRILADGTLDLNTMRDELWTKENLFTDAVCGSCTFSPSCLGLHCPLTRMQEKRRPCPTQKVFADEFLRQ